MNFWKKISKSTKQQPTENYFLKQEAEPIDLYANSWVNNEIPEIDTSIAELIYQIDLIKQTLYDFSNFGTCQNGANSPWNNKGDLNFPGPFYTEATDTCGTGIIEAPRNVILDEHCAEFVMIQPRTQAELVELDAAAASETFAGYGCDGNTYWTTQRVKEWWANRQDIFTQLQNEDLVKMNCNQEKRYCYYLENYAESDLRKYCFFLENGYYPIDEKLPQI